MAAGDVFPLVPDFVFEQGDRHRTLITEMESGKEQRRAIWPGGLAEFVVRKRFVSKADIVVLRSFFNARQGAFDSFWFDNPDDHQATGESIGTGDGATTTFNLAKYPVKTAGGTFTLYEGGVPKTGSLSNDDVNFVSKATFDAAPANGAALTADYQFYYIVRFLEDLFVRDLVAYQLYDVTTRLQEVRL